MVSLAIFAISSGVLYDCFRASLFLQDKNFALNEANTNLQWSHYNLLSNLESAAFFVDCANYDPNAQTFTAVPPGTWGNAVRFMRLLPVTCYVLPADGSGYTINNPPPATRNVSLSSSTQNVYLSYNPSLYSPSVIPMSARFYPAFPAVSGTVSGGSSPGAKPGLNFDNIDTSVADVIGLHFPTPLGAGAFQDCNRAYFIVESAFAVTQDPNDGHKQLLYFADTSQTANPVIVCQKLDGSNQTQPNDPTIPIGGTAGTFCIVSGTNSVQTLLPIRSQEYFNVMSRDSGSAARNNTWVNVNLKFRLRETL
jgi:hypothetical protein